MNRQKIHWLLAFLFLTRLVSAQLNENFTDGDMVSNPAWSGDILKFTVNAGKLKLQAPAIAETAYLSTPSEAIYNGNWEFYLQMDFTPSSSNFAKIYLVSDQSNLNHPLNGYFVKAGNTARDVSLYRQNGTVETKIIDGIDDRLNLALVKVKIRVSRSPAGQWQLFSDIGPSGVYSQEGTFVDNTHSASSFFGIHCTYTATRSDKFWFDDFTVTGIPVPDTSPPSIQTVTAANAKEINLFFSEPLNSSYAQDAANYSLSGVGNPSQAILLPDQKTIQLIFTNSLTNGRTYPLQIIHVRDLLGNEMMSTTVSVLFFQAVISKSKDILITEIFPDPSPQIGLPTAEFVEIYNRSQNAFDLSDWKLSDGSSTSTFPAHIILPGEYRIIAASANVNLFGGYGQTLGLSNFPTLNNDGDNITLSNAEGLTIDSVNYSLEWYRDPDKQEGGWTIELIDPNNPCGEQDNWIASENAAGGTPGKQNSVLANKPDMTAPKLLSVFPDRPSRIILTFDEKLDPESLDSKNFTLQQSSKFSKILFSDNSLRNIILELPEDLKVRSSYLLSVSNIRDCNGNLIEDLSFSFGLPEVIDSLDVVVNEVLFNPRAGGVDFVEVFNASQKFLNLVELKFGNYINGIPINVVQLVSTNILFPPSGFAVFTSDPRIVKLQYPNSLDKNLIKSGMPSLPDDAGSIAILNQSGKVLDALTYTKEWHSEFVKNDEGVSLERIITLGLTNERSNWTSASARTGFATPGFLNSQYRGEQNFNENVVVIPEVFSPDQGNGDFTQIRYRFDQGNWVANVKVYDQQGHLLRILASNEILGHEGFFRWDGDRDDGQIARSGYYMVWFEIFNSEGTVRTIRKRVVVATK